MKLTSLFIALLLLAAAAPPHRWEPLRLAHEEYKLNSGSRPGGITRALVRLKVPRHTDYLVYTVAASPSNPLKELGLTTQIKEQMRIDGVRFTIGTHLLNKLTKPSADGATDVLLVRDSLQAWRYVHHKGNADAVEEYSRHHIANAIVGIPMPYINHDTVLYLTLRNPEGFQAQYVSIEVTAMHRIR